MRRITTSAVRNALGVATRLGLFVSCMSLAACDVVASSSGTACERCRITRSIVGWIGVGVVKGAPLDVAATSPGNFVVLDSRSAAEFDSQGAFLSRLPAFTRGDSTGPYTTVAAVGVDSLVLVDNDARVLRIVGQLAH